MTAKVKQGTLLNKFFGQIRDILEQNDVPDFHRAPYQAGTNEIFAGLVAVEMRSQKVREFDPDFVSACARGFGPNFWDWYESRDPKEWFLLPGGMITQINWAGAITARDPKSKFGFAGAVQPSVSRPGVFQEPASQENHGEIFARIQGLLPQIRSRIDKHILPGAPGVASIAAVPPFKGWCHWTIRVTLTNGTQRIFSQHEDRYLHASDARLLHWANQFVTELNHGYEAYAALLRSHDFTACLADSAQRTKLPISFHLAPFITGGARDAPCAIVLIEGYGADGSKSVVETRHRVLNAEPFDLKDSILEGHLFHQRQRHKAFGPVPGSQAASFMIDGPTAARLKQFNRGRAPIDAYVAYNQIEDAASGVRIEIKGNNVRGEFSLNKKVSWKNNSVIIKGVDLPDTLLQSLIGQPLTVLIDVPGLESCTTIKTVRKTINSNTKLLVVGVMNEPVPISDL